MTTSTYLLNELHDAERAGWLQTLAERIGAARMAARTGRDMSASLLTSQLTTLEVPEPKENAQISDVASRPEIIVTAAVGRWSAAGE